jgi:serine/threonine-protein kinase
MGEHSGASPTTGAAATSKKSSAGRFGEYLVERRLGIGGMGAVYLASRESDGQAVALKVLNPVAGANESLVKRFIREAQVLLTLEHPNIVKAYDLGSVNGQHFISMEYVPGENLGDTIKREERIDSTRALGIMRQIADALSYGWEHDVVHRDLKPENILVKPDGTCKLADLGLAVLASREDLRITAPGTVMGTPEYMSPEQARGEHEIDTRSDVYSLGCAIYHAVCGYPAFEGPSPVAILQKQLREEPRRPSEVVPGLALGVENILMKCMKKELADRYQTCAELIQAIDRQLAPAAREAAKAPVSAEPKASVQAPAEPSVPAPAKPSATKPRKDTSRRRAFDGGAAAAANSSGSPADSAPAAPAASAASAAPDPDDAAAVLIAQARASAPAGSQGQTGPGSEPTFQGGGPHPHPAADLGGYEPRGKRPTRATIHVPAQRKGKLPMVFLGIVVGGAVLSLVATVLYLLFTTPG